MAENRVTAHVVEVGIERTTVPGDARVTAHVVEVGLLKDVAPGAFARVTAHYIEVGLLRSTGVSGVRSGDFFFGEW